MTDENTPEQNASAETAPSDKERWIDAIARLIELTQNGELDWSVGGRTTPGRGEPITPPYFAHYKNHRYKLEELWVKSPPPALSRMLLPSWFRPTSGGDYHIITLDLVDLHGRSLYSVPYVSPMWDLLRIVQKKTAAEDALNDLLG